MTHLTDEQLTAAYYSDGDAAVALHLNECAECQAEFARLQQFLDDVREYPVPERGASYSGEVWARLLPQIEAQTPRRRWNRWWTAAPAFAAVLAAVFFAGVFFDRHWNAPGTPPKARDRVLLIAVGTHLDRSEILLAELAHGSPDAAGFADERDRAADLLAENRLYRLAAKRSGDSAVTGILDEVERVLLDVANSPANASDSELEALQQRIASEGLLFKVRVVRSNILRKGQQL